jgi:hypothetical protein
MNTSQAPLFEFTLAVIQETERRLLIFRSRGTIIDGIIHTILLPFPFLHIGMADLLRPAFKWAVISFGLLIAVTFLFPDASLPKEIKSYVILGCIYAPLFLVIFAVPSTFAFDSIKGIEIHSLADHIYKHGIDCDEKIKAFEHNLSNISERTYARTKALQWLVATVWATFLYFMNQLNSFVSKIEPQNISAVISENIGNFIIFGLYTFFSFLVIIGHKKGSDAIFRRLHFAVQELKFRLLTQLPTAAQPAVTEKVQPQSDRVPELEL